MSKHKIIGHESFFYYTANMKAAVEFYKNIVGLELKVFDEYWSVFSLPDGGKFALHLGEKKSNSEHNSSHEIPAVVFRVEDVEASMNHLKSQGAKQISPFSSQEWGQEVDFEDLDGNLFRIARLK